MYDRNGTRIQIIMFMCETILSDVDKGMEESKPHPEAWSLGGCG
jgi:hypothetical protein